MRDRRFPAAGRTEDREHLSGLDVQTDAAKDRPLLFVAEAHVAQRDRAAHRSRQWLRILGVADRRLLAQQLLHAADARARALVLRVHVGDALDRLEKAAEEGVERDQPADGECAGDDLIAAEAEDQRGAGDGDENVRHAEEQLAPAAADLQLDSAPRHFREPPRLGRLSRGATGSAGCCSAAPAAATCARRRYSARRRRASAGAAVRSAASRTRRRAAAARPGSASSSGSA